MYDTLNKTFLLTQYKKKKNLNKQISKYINASDGSTKNKYRNCNKYLNRHELYINDLSFGNNITNFLFLNT